VVVLNAFVYRCVVLKAVVPTYQRKSKILFLLKHIQNMRNLT